MTKPYALMRAGFPYLKTIGEFKRMHFPSDIVIAGDGRLFTFGNGSRYSKGKSGPIHVTNLEDENLGSFGWKADYTPVHDAEFLWPCQMILDSNGKLYCSDQGCDRISVFSVNGEFLGKWGEHGSGDGQINRPSGLAFDDMENIYVVDTLNHRIQKFTQEGKFISKWGSFGSKPGQFNLPWGIATDEEENVYISDWRNDRIQVFTPDGDFVFMFGTPGHGDGELHRPAGIAVDKHGDIYVCDWGNNRVQLFTPEGRYVQQFLGDATLSKDSLERMMQRSGRQKRMRDAANLEQEKRFARPRSVRVDQEGHMYVPDYEHYRVQIYKKEAYVMDESSIIPPFKVPTLNAN